MYINKSRRPQSYSFDGQGSSWRIHCSSRYWAVDLPLMPLSVMSVLLNRSQRYDLQTQCRAVPYRQKLWRLRGTNDVFTDWSNLSSYKSFFSFLCSLYILFKCIQVAVRMSDPDVNECSFKGYELGLTVRSVGSNLTSLNFASWRKKTAVSLMALWRMKTYPPNLQSGAW